MLAMLFMLLAAQPDLFSPHGEKAVVLLFIRSDCPISNRYVPEIRRLYQKYSAQGIDFRLVYPEPGLDSAAMEKHRKEYGYTIPGLLDEGHHYVNLAGARITPETAVFVQGKLVYLGRIDDQYVDLGKPKRAVESHDLEDVLTAVVAGKSVPLRKTRAIGCAIENLQ